MNPFNSFFTIGSIAADGEALLCLNCPEHKGVPVKVKDVMQLLQHDNTVGDGTIFIGEGTRLFFPNFHQNAMRFLSLFESPDFIANKYSRAGLRCVLFIGDANGIIYGWNDKFPSHGVLMRAFYKKDSEHEFNVIGEPKELRVDLSGAILPQHIDGFSYVSLWGSDEAPIRPYIDLLLRKMNLTKNALYALKYSDRGMSTEALRDWYARLGFKNLGSSENAWGDVGYDMER